MLGLEPRYSRKHKYLYSYSEIEPAIKDFEEAVKNAREKGSKDENSLDAAERSLITLSDKWQKLLAIRFAFDLRPTPNAPDARLLTTDPRGLIRSFQTYLNEIAQTNGRYDSAAIPMCIYLDQQDDDPEKMRRWKSYAQANFNARASADITPFFAEMKSFFSEIKTELAKIQKDDRLGPDRMKRAVEMGTFYSQLEATIEQLRSQTDGPNRIGREADSSTIAFSRILNAYRTSDPETFNKLVAEQNDSVKDDDWIYQYEPKELVSANGMSYESFINRFEPFYYSALLYVFALIMGLFGWLLLPQIMNRAAFWSIVAIFALHTFAMVSRIYISGRPPVTNLYSSALFIGWGGVLLGIIFEMIFKIGVGNIIAAICGASTLTIAHLLHAMSDSGDTVSVMQAVLDTQFWLATHVTCITLGYTTTFVAGILGILYVFAGVCSPSLTPQLEKELGRMMYGALCFAILFSFVGTVLGGLWADDSWGRFWGWDPKENGALMIVLWNVIVLHCRWDRIAGTRGVAVLAIVGNICTSFSWFAVNQLGKGLHAYGFQDGMMATLGWVWLAHLVVIGAGCIPKYAWWSSRHQRDMDAGLV